MNEHKKKFLSEPIFPFPCQVDTGTCTLFPHKFTRAPLHSDGVAIIYLIASNPMNKFTSEPTIIDFLPLMLYTKYPVNIEAMSTDELEDMCRNNLGLDAAPIGTHAWAFYHEYLSPLRPNKDIKVRAEFMILPMSPYWFDKVDRVKFMVSGRLSIVYKYKGEDKEHIADLYMFHSAIRDRDNKKLIVHDYLTPLFVSDEDTIHYGKSHIVPVDDTMLDTLYNYKNEVTYLGDNENDVICLLDSMRVMSYDYMVGNRFPTPITVWYPTLHEVNPETEIDSMRELKIRFSSVFGKADGKGTVHAVVPMLCGKRDIVYDPVSIGKSLPAQADATFYLSLPSSHCRILSVEPVVIPSDANHMLVLGDEYKFDTMK